MASRYSLTWSQMSALSCFCWSQPPCRHRQRCSRSINERTMSRPLEQMRRWWMQKATKLKKSHSAAFVLDSIGEFEQVHCARTSWGRINNLARPLFRSQLSNLKIQTHSLTQIDNLFFAPSLSGLTFPRVHLAFWLLSWLSLIWEFYGGGGMEKHHHLLVIINKTELKKLSQTDEGGSDEGCRPSSCKGANGITQDA